MLLAYWGLSAELFLIYPLYAQSFTPYLENRRLVALYGVDKDYKFGDFTRSFLKKAVGGPVSKITGKEYEFGDISRHLDQLAKTRINKMTGKSNYEFGDISRWVDGQVKDKVNDFTGNQEYRFGDITKAMIQKVRNGDYAAEDVWLALRILVSIGAEISPIARVLPIQTLLTMVNMGLAGDVGGRATAILAEALELRVAKALSGGKENTISDVAKRELEKQVMGLIGKESYSDYQLGDLSRAVSSALPTAESKGRKRDNVIDFTEDTADQLRAWDRKLLEQADAQMH